MSGTFPRILVIDDDVPVRENLVRCLPLEGYVTLEAAIVAQRLRGRIVGEE
jgi:hypothetical protein